MFKRLFISVCLLCVSAAPTWAFSSNDTLTDDSGDIGSCIFFIFEFDINRTEWAVIANSNLLEFKINNSLGEVQTSTPQATSLENQCLVNDVNITPTGDGQNWAAATYAEIKIEWTENASQKSLILSRGDMPTNAIPTAEAGENKTVLSGASAILNGAGDDSDTGQTLSYSWIITAGNDDNEASLTNETTATPTFNAPTLALGDADRVFTVTLTVTDSSGAANNSTTDTVQVTVTAPTDPTSPEVKILGAPSSFKVGDSFSLNIEFNEDVTGLLVSELVVVNGSASNLQGSGKAYTVTITPTGKGDVSVQVPAGVAQDAANNGNNASNKLTIKNTTVEETQKVIAGVMQARANHLLSNQPELINALRGNAASGGSLNGSGTENNGILNFLTDASNPVWAKVHASWSKNGAVESRYLLGTVGAHYKFNENFLAGVMAQFDHIQSKVTTATVSGTGWLIGPYVVAKIPDQPLYFESRVLWGQTNNKVSPFKTYTDNYKTDRFLARGKIAGDIKFDGVTLTPNLVGSFVKDTQKAYTDSLGNLVPQQSIELGELDLGFDFSMPIAVSSGKFYLTGGVSGIYSHTNATGFAASQIHATDGFRARADLGFDYQFNEFVSFDLDLFYDGIGRDNYDNYGGTTGVKVNF